MHGKYKSYGEGRDQALMEDNFQEILILWFSK